MYPLFICYPAAAVACALRLLAACVAAASESRRDGKESRRDGKERKRKAKAAYRVHFMTIVSILSRLPYWGAGVWLRIPIPRPYPAPERRDRAKVKGGKAVYIPLTFARAAIMGFGRGIGLRGDDKPRVGRRQARRRRRAAGARARGRARQAQHHERGQAQSARTRRETEQPPHKSELH